MKSVRTKWLAAHLLAAAAAFFSLSPLAAADDGQMVRSEAAATELAAAAAPGGNEQLSKANAAYARGEYAEAFRLYRNIAVLGISEAHYRLGLMYLDGVGTRKNLRQAEYWLKLAASQNHPGAAATLGSIKSTEAQG
jgi:TPR repeat protein